MPKIKTNRAAAKRFKKTGTGKIVFRKSCSSHILTKNVHMIVFFHFFGSIIEIAR